MRIIKEILISLLIGAIIAGIFLFAAINAYATDLPDITEPCGKTVKELEAVLKGNLKPYAQAFLHAEEDYQINALFLASVAAAESGWGKHCFRPNNFFGFMTNREFSSPEECIDFVAWWIRKHYINENGKYFRGGTITDIGKIWCPDGTGDWERLVTGIYSRMCKGVQ